MFLRPTASARSTVVLMTAAYPHQVEIGKATISGLPSRPLNVNYPGMSESAPYLAIGRRLAALREGMSDMNQREWAEHHGFSPTRYNNWEKGVRRIMVDEAQMLCDRYGLTLDAIYRGRLEGLSEKMRKLLSST